MLEGRNVSRICIGRRSCGSTIVHDTRNGHLCGILQRCGRLCPIPARLRKRSTVIRHVGRLLSLEN